MIVAITGGNGFVGRHLARRLARQGHEIRLLSRRPGTAPFGTIHVCRLGIDPSDRLIPFVDGADALVHCAGEVADPARMEATHVTGTRDLLEVACGRLAHWVQLSSVGVYGPVRDGVVTEDSALRPVGPYEVTKAASDALVLDDARVAGMTVSILRPSIIFSEDMNNASLRQMAKAICKGWFFFVGRPGASANYVHIDRVVDALEFCLSSPAARNQVFNLSDWATMEHFVGALAAGLGCRPPARRLPGALVRLTAGLGALLPRFPLTPSRVAALSSRAKYPIDKLLGAGFRLSRSLEEDAAAVGAAWRHP